jgi:phosphodiesterase/alkaline phosphatase D-like protein
MPPSYHPVQDKPRWRKRHVTHPLLSSISLLLFLATTFTGSLAAVLTHGPVAGGVTPNRARVFVRTDSTGSASIQIGTDSALLAPWITDSITTSSQSDFTAIISLPNLTPDTRYFMNVLINGIPQLKPPYPTFKTFPPADRATSFKFAILTDLATQYNVNETVNLS